MSGDYPRWRLFSSLNSFSMSKKLLRPPAAFNDSDDSEDEEEANPTLSSDEDEDDVEEEEEEEEEEESNEQEEQRQKKRKAGGGGGAARKKSKASSFFELEAEDDDDDDEEEDHRRRGDPDSERMDEEAREIMLQQDRRRARAGNLFSTQRSVAEMAKEIEDRHRMQSRVVNRSALDRPRASVGGASVMQRDDDMDEGGPEVYSAVSQQSLLPSVKDPSLWMIECLTGKEQELVYQIMNKCVAYARQGRPLAITGAIAAQTKGRIYVESFSEPSVMEAIANIRGIWQGRKKLVPISDMTTVMTVTSKKKPVKKNEWVRMTRGHYKGDLALVREVKDSGLRCIIQCVPRLDLVLSDLPPEEAKVRRNTVRPPQKFFNSQDIIARGKHDLERRRYPPLGIMCDYYDNNYYESGYLLKEMTVGSMVKPCTEDDPPNLDELQKFRRGKSSGGHDDDEAEENAGSKLAGSLLDELANLQESTGLGRTAPGGGLQIGDTVKVIEGDLMGMLGKLVSQHDNSVKIKPIDTKIELGDTGEIEFLLSQVCKHIPIGAHVKVTDGRYANETGQVVAVDDEAGGDATAVILIDIINKEITVRTSQLRESTEVTSNQDKLAGYELYDLVAVTGSGSANEVGVIVRVGREDFTIVNNQNIALEVRPEELRGKMNGPSGRAVALDVQGNQLRVGDSVNVVDGTHKGKRATIKRMNRSQLWLHSQTRSEHAGIFVVRSRSCMLAGSNRTTGRAADVGVSPFATPASSATRGPVGGRAKRDDALIGKTVRIQAGQWKGYIGQVTDTTATHVQVELHSRSKKVMVKHERVSVVGDKYGATEDPTRMVIVPAPGLAPTTPFVAAGQTPMHGGATPMHAGDGLEADGMDDVWRPGGAVDQEPAVKEEEGRDTSISMSDENDGWGTSNTQSDWGAPPPPKKDEVSGTAKVESQIDADLAEAIEMPAWFMERVEVEVKSSQKKGVIRQTQNKTAVVEYEDGTRGNVGVNDLSMVSPVEHDAVLVTGGNEIGLEGSLVCIDGTDAILKVANDDFKIVDVSFLAKVVQA